MHHCVIPAEAGIQWWHARNVGSEDQVALYLDAP